jgi:hypothetical protein
VALVNPVVNAEMRMLATAAFDEPPTFISFVYA